MNKFLAKICGHCAQEKSDNDFYFKRGRFDLSWCKKCCSERNRERYAAKRPILIAQAKAWAARNRTHAHAQRKAWRKERPHKEKEYRAKPRAKERTYINNANRRGLERNAEGRFTAADIRAMYAAQNGLCNHCTISLTDGYHIDHKWPLSRGGSNWPCNLQLLCPPCNMRKCDSLPVIMPPHPRPRSKV